MTNTFKPGDEVVRLEGAPDVRGVTGEVYTVSDVPASGYLQLHGFDNWFADRYFELAGRPETSPFSGEDTTLDLAFAFFVAHTGRSVNEWANMTTDQMRPYFEAAKAVQDAEEVEPKRPVGTVADLTFDYDTWRGVWEGNFWVSTRGSFSDDEVDEIDILGTFDRSVLDSGNLVSQVVASLQSDGYTPDADDAAQYIAKALIILGVH